MKCNFVAPGVALRRPLTEDEFKHYRNDAQAMEMDRTDAEALRKGELLPANMTFAARQAMR